jgi:hypothetical protein
MLGLIPFDSLQTPDPEVLGEAVRVHGVESPVGPVLTLECPRIMSTDLNGLSCKIQRTIPAFGNPGYT